MHEIDYFFNMLIGIHGSGTTESAAKIIKKVLDNAEIKSFSITKSTEQASRLRIIVLGGDKGVRNYFHKTFDSTSANVLGIK